MNDDQVDLSVEEKNDMDIGNYQADGFCEEERENKEDKVEENEIEEDMMVKGMEEKKDAEDVKKGEGGDLIYSRYTKQRRTSVKENEPVFTQQRKRRRGSRSAISSNDKAGQSDYAPSEHIDERPSRSERHYSASEPSFDYSSSFPGPNRDTAAKDMEYLRPVQGSLEWTTRGHERFYALKFKVLSSCQHCSSVEPHGSKSIGSSVEGLVTNVASQSSVASNFENGKTVPRRRPGRPKKNPDGPSTTAENRTVAIPKRRGRPLKRREGKGSCIDQQHAP